MSWMTRGAAMAAVTAGGVAVGRALIGRGPDGRPGAGDDGPGDGWQVVTINRSPDELTPGGRLPDPIARLGVGVQVRVSPAPGDKGTELAVRRRRSDPELIADLTARLTGDDPRQAVRAALRQAKQLAETGELLRPDRASTSRPTRAGTRPDGGTAPG